MTNTNEKKKTYFSFSLGIKRTIRQESGRNLTCYFWDRFRRRPQRLLVDRIVEEIMGEFAGGSPLSERCRGILDRLSREYGQTLELSNHGVDGIVFKVLDEKKK